MFFLHFYNFSRLSYLLALILVLPLVACSGSGGDSSSPDTNNSSFSWVPPSEREDGTGLSPSEIAGFHIHYGTNSGDYSNTINIDDHTATQVILPSIPSGTYFFVVTTIDTEGQESAFSSEIAVTL